MKSQPTDWEETVAKNVTDGCQKQDGVVDWEETVAKNVTDGCQKQDGVVERSALTPSCKNTRITTSCWTIIDRKTLELTKKDTPYPKTKEKPK